MSRFVIIDYLTSNLASIQNAMMYLGCDISVSNSVDDIKAANALILPGVGAFSEGIGNLNRLGLVAPLNQCVLIDKKPILGICLGFQLFAQYSDEMGRHKGLGWIKADVSRLEVTDDLRLPHIGWNTVSSAKDAFLFQNLPDHDFYFVHSYAFHNTPDCTTVSTCNYGNDFIAAVEQGHIMGTQFHPEKSHASGLTVLRNFISFVNEYYA